MNEFFYIERADDFELAFQMIKSRGLIIDPADAIASLSDELEVRGYFDYINAPYKCLLDRQVVSYLVDVANGKTLLDRPESEVYKSAIALQAFLVLCGISSEPSIAFAEYGDTNGMEVADQQLSMFRAVDNLSVDTLLDIAVGRENRIDDSFLTKFPCGELKNISHQQPERIKAFEINLTVVKKAILLKLAGNNGLSALKELFDWMFYRYIYTRPSVHFMAVYLSSRPFKKMIKTANYTGARNAAWDLCLVQEWTSMNIKNRENKILLASFDRSIQSAAKFAFKFESNSDSTYTRMLDEQYVHYWPNASNRKVVVDLINRFDKEIDSKCRDANTIGKEIGFEFIKRVRKEVDDEFHSQTAT